MGKENKSVLDQFEALNLPKAQADALTYAMGGLSVVMHRLGASTADENVLSSLILDFIEEVRAR